MVEGDKGLEGDEAVLCKIIMVACICQKLTKNSTP